MPIQAADIMTRNVVTVSPDTSVVEVARLLSEHEISAVPVCDSAGKVLGIVSEGDLVQPYGEERMTKRSWWLGLLAEGTELAPEFIDYIRTDRRKAADLMTRPVVSATKESTIPQLAWLMTDHHVKRLPILSDGKLVGIVSRADLVRALAHAPAELLSVV